MDEKAVPFIVIPAKIIPSPVISIDPDVLKILYRLQNHGFLAYLVAVASGTFSWEKNPKDFDVATDAHPQQIPGAFSQFPIDRTADFASPTSISGEGKFIEVSTFRRRSEI